VLITFDDGYLDFLIYAWPLLKRYGFLATVFLVADEIGQSNRWDHNPSEEVPLLGWKEIRDLRGEGVEFGSHSASHCSLTELLPEEVVREGVRSKAIIESGLGQPINAFAYPYGSVNPTVKHLIGGCGYVFGLSCRGDLSKFNDTCLLDLPRIEVTGSDSLKDFVAKLSIYR
jgi:peptidoglycan/xylan/chitin deacetylase (PgdA/CDA1 family)